MKLSDNRSFSESIVLQKEPRVQQLINAQRESEREGETGPQIHRRHRSGPPTNQLSSR